jgi:hypothetical protein
LLRSKKIALNPLNLKFFFQKRFLFLSQNLPLGLRKEGKNCKQLPSYRANETGSYKKIAFD